jgi:hypothetical protein
MAGDFDADVLRPVRDRSSRNLPARTIAALASGPACAAGPGKCVAPALAHFKQVMRTVNHHQAHTPTEANPSFLVVNREAFDAVSRINRMPEFSPKPGGASGATRWRVSTFEGDGSAWT